MADTGYDDQNAVLANRATGYDVLLGKQRLSRWMSMSTPYAAGALYSTARDLWKWDQVLRSHSLLSKEMEERMFTAELENYGYGWFVGGSGDALVTWHTGNMPGVSTSITRVPFRERCIILLSNQSGAAVDEAVRGILAILDGRPLREPALRPALILARNILRRGIETGLAQLADTLSSLGDGELEREFNNLGYGLLSHRRVEEALLLLEFNTRAFPESGNTWDSLGEAHLQAGNRELAIGHYRKALEVDPTNTTSASILDELLKE
ncbi:MAG: hypothetical protein ACI8TQ_004120 [Planctomycetota bacterium]|jgi:hypothetical protein